MLQREKRNLRIEDKRQRELHVLVRNQASEHRKNRVKNKKLYC